MKPIVLLLADDGSTGAIRSMLAFGGYGFQSFVSFQQLLEGLEGLPSAILVSDLDHPGGPGADIVKVLHQRGLGRLPVILLSRKTTVRDAVTLMRTGVHDLLEKPVTPDRLLTSLATAAAKLRSPAGANRAATAAYAALTPREREVGKHLAAGLTTRQVADILGISVRTVDVYRGTIFRKLGVANVAALASLIARSVQP